MSSKKHSQPQAMTVSRANGAIITQMLSSSIRNAASKFKSSSLSNATTVLQVVGRIANKQAKSTTAVKKQTADEKPEASKSRSPVYESSSMIKENELVNSEIELSHTQKSTPIDQQSLNNKAKEVSNRTSVAKIPMALSPSSPTNFSSIEREQQQLALITMAQDMKDQKRSKGHISLNKQWQGQPISHFMNKEKCQTVNGVLGMKGSKLAMNSQFRKMHTVLKNRAKDSTLGSCNILLAQAATYSPPPAYHRRLNSGRKMNHILDKYPRGVSTRTRKVIMCDTVSQTEAPADPSRAKQSILVLQNQHKRENTHGNNETVRKRDNDTITETHVLGKLNNSSIDNMIVEDNSQHGKELILQQKSQISSHEGYEPLEATMIEAGTRVFKKPLSKVAANHHVVATNTDCELPFELLYNRGAREQKSHSPLAQYVNPIKGRINSNEDLCSDIVRRASGGNFVSSTFKAYGDEKHEHFETVIGKHSSQTPMQDEVATYARMTDQGVDIESIGGMNETVINMQAEIISKDKTIVITSGGGDPDSNVASFRPSDDPTLASNSSQLQTRIRQVAAIGDLNQSSKQLNSTFMISQHKQVQDEIQNVRNPSEFRVNLPSFNNRSLLPQQQRVRMGRWARSQHIRRRNKTDQQLQSETTQMIIGKSFKPKLVFKEQEIQTLYDRAEKPIQQIVEKIILEDLDQFNGFTYASKKLASRRPTPQPTRKPLQITTVSSTNQLMPNPKQPLQSSRPQLNNDYLKYEFIERLLRTPDLQKTQEHLQEMMNLYQELLEKNLSDAASGNQKGFEANSGIASQQSIGVHIDLKPQTLLSQNKAIVNKGTNKVSRIITKRSDITTVCTFQVKHKFEQDHDNSLYMKKLESQRVLNTVHDSMQTGNVSVMTAIAGDYQSCGTHTNMKKNYRNSISTGIGFSSNEKNRVQVDGLISMKLQENELMADQNTTDLLVVEIGGQKRQDQSDARIRPSPTKRSNITKKDESEKQMLMLREPDMEIAANSSSAGFDEKTDSEDRTHLALMVPFQLGKQPTLEREFCVSMGSQKLLSMDQYASPQSESRCGPLIASETPMQNSPHAIRQKKQMQMKLLQPMAKVLLSHTTNDPQAPYYSNDCQDLTTASKKIVCRLDHNLTVVALSPPVQADLETKMTRPRPHDIRSQSFNRVTIAKRTRELNCTGLSPRIRILEQKIMNNSRQPKVKTATDVHKVTQVLGFSPFVTGSAKVQHQAKNSADLELQMARSAFLSFQANKLNSGKVIVGNELRNTSQRMQFIEKMFSKNKPQQPKAFGGIQSVTRPQSTIRATKSPMPRLRNQPSHRLKNMSAATST